MKKILLFFLALCATLPLWASNTITYTATAQLPETTSGWKSGLHTNAFYNGDTQLTMVSHTFDDATHIGTITLSGEVTKIGTKAFQSCSALTSITIPASVTTIGNQAFANCSGLTSITIPASVTSIGYSAFNSCSGLTSITIPGSVTSIGDNVFNQCTGLTSVTIPGSVTSIGYMAFYYCEGLTSVTIPASVTSIGDMAFESCSGLTSITIPGSVTSIGYGAFAGTALTSIKIPASITSIGSSTFSRCSALTSITIPASVTSIGDEAFSECSNLATIRLLCTTPPTIGLDIFNESSSLSHIYVPCGYADTYKNASGWEDFKDNITAACAGPETLSDDTNPATTLTSLSGQTKDLVISRILWRDGYYNTLCLPFSLSAAELAAGPLAGFSALKTFTSATVNGEYLDIVLADATSIEAGRPYLISWPAAATNIIDPQFDGVLISATSASTDGAGSVQFVGSFAPVSLAAGDSHQLFVGANNVLYWSDGTGNLPGFRAYFNISAGDGAPIRLGMSARFVESGTDATTALPSALSPLQPAEKLLRNGQVLILRDGQTFDLLGRPVF